MKENFQQQNLDELLAILQVFQSFIKFATYRNFQVTTQSAVINLLACVQMQLELLPSNELHCLLQG